MPDTFLIDKVVRNIAHYMIEMTEARHDQGVTIGKLFEIINQYKEGGKPYHHYPVHNGVKYTRVVFKRASDEIIAGYDAKRKEIRKVMMAESIDNIRNAEDGVQVEKKEKVPSHVQVSNNVREELRRNPKISIRELSEKLGISKDTATKAKKYIMEYGGL